MPTNNSINSQDPIQVAKGGTGLNTVAQGDLLIASASNTLASLPKDTNSTRYLSNTGTNNAPAYAQVDLSNGVTGTLPVGNGGLGITTTPTNGQIPVGNGTNYTAATLTAGSGISITNAAGSVTVANTANPGAMVLLHTITFNNTASSYDLTSYVTGYDTYKFIASAVPNSTGANPLIGLQFSIDGGATFLNSSYITFYQYFSSGGSVGSNVYTDLVPIAFLNSSANYLASCDAMMTGYGGTSGALVQSYYVSSGTTGVSPQVSGGTYFGSTLNGIRITNPVGTNFIAGKFSIYGIAT